MRVVVWVAVVTLGLTASLSTSQPPPNSLLHLSSSETNVPQVVLVSSLQGASPPRHLTPPDTPIFTTPYKKSGRRFRTTGSRQEEYLMCSPSRRDLLRLLLALHEARKGHRNMEQVVKLCNSYTNPASVNTNIRFMG